MDGNRADSDGSPPPVPPRPADQSALSGTQGYGYGSPYGVGYLGNPMPMAGGGYGYSAPGTMYGGGGRFYGSGVVGGSPFSTGAESNFVRLAEESFRGPFQSVDSVVQVCVFYTSSTGEPDEIIGKHLCAAGVKGLLVAITDVV